MSVSVPVSIVGGHSTAREDRTAGVRHGRAVPPPPSCSAGTRSASPPACARGSPTCSSGSGSGRCSCGSNKRDLISINWAAITTNSPATSMLRDSSSVSRYSRYCAVMCSIGDVEDVDLFALDQVDEQVERTLEDGERDGVAGESPILRHRFMGPSCRPAQPPERAISGAIMPVSTTENVAMRSAVFGAAKSNATRLAGARRAGKLICLIPARLSAAA